VNFNTPLPVHAATAKDAYNQQVSQVACVTEPAVSIETQSVTVTWVYQQPNFGLAFIRAVCSNQTSPFAIMNMERDAHGDWTMGSTVTPSFGSQQGGMPPGVTLPQDSYYIEVDSVSSSATGGPSMVIGYWVSPTRAYIMTHYSESATRPSGATPLTVNGRAGWVTRSNDMVTVTEPLADGTTIFFSGTGSMAEIESMAQAALAHALVTLPPLDS
jgi:hypothetical protein